MILTLCVLFGNLQAAFAGEIGFEEQMPLDDISVLEEAETEEAAAETDAEETDTEETDIEETVAEEELEQASAPSVTYRTHIQTDGWQGWKKDGEMSGTQGRSRRLEGIEIKVNGDADLGIRYKTHIQTYGWETAWKQNGQMSGTEGQAKRLEAIRIELTGGYASKYDVWYCVHAQHFGWLNWAKNGADAGTAGYAYRLEGIKIRILPKGSSAPANEGKSQAAFYSKKDGPSMNKTVSGVAYNTHVQTYGWQEYVYNGGVAGTQGQSKRLEGIHIALVEPKYSGGIEYRTHIQTYGWETSWRSNGQMSGTSGQAKRLEAIQIRLTGEMASKYDIYYRVHAQKFGWMGWARNGEQAGTAGYGYRLEGIQIVLVSKGGSAPSASLGGNRQTTAAAFAQNEAGTLFKTIAGNYQVYRLGGYSRDEMSVGQNGAVTGRSYAQNYDIQGMDYCGYSGVFTDVKKVDAYTYTVKLSRYSIKGTPGATGQEEGFKVRYFDIGYGNKTFTIYMPGHKTGTLPYYAKQALQIKNSGKTLPDTLQKAVIYTWDEFAYC